MKDRELLELAAKAAGIPLAYAPHDHAYCGVLTAEWDKTRNTPYWSPLTDDGDALRLAVKLRLDLHYEDQPSWLGEIVEVLSQRDEAGACHCTTVALADDPCAATRRAIVRAAAEIGKEAS